MAAVGMTEAELLHAGFRSKCIRAYPDIEEGGVLASEILLEYIDPDSESEPDGSPANETSPDRAVTSANEKTPPA